MRDIAHKPTTERTATAEARLVMKPESVAAVRDNKGPKPDIVATARAASYLGVKNTAMAIPHCHPIPVEAVRTDFEFLEGEIRIEVAVKTVYKTGVEIEAMHGASVAALTVYDMMKPVDTDIEITGIKLLEKRGGKSDRTPVLDRTLKAAVLVCSDAVVEGRKTDAAGQLVRERLEGLDVELDYEVMGNAGGEIRSRAEAKLADGVDLLITVGGTGLMLGDETPEAIRPLIDRETPGIMEAARSHGQARTPKAMVSRGLAGAAGNTLVICLPGSTRGAKESLDALFPAVLHIVKLLGR